MTGYSEVIHERLRNLDTTLTFTKFEKPFDAVLGRFVLRYCSDPAVALQKVAAHFRPGGIVAFQEFDMDNIRSRHKYAA